MAQDKRFRPKPRVTYRPVDQGKWDLPDEELFVLAVLEVGQPPLNGWKFDSDEATMPRSWGEAYTKFRRRLEEFLVQHYTPPVGRTPDYRNHQVYRKRNRFLKWIWRERQKNLRASSSSKTPPT